MGNTIFKWCALTNVPTGSNCGVKRLLVGAVINSLMLGLSRFLLTLSNTGRRHLRTTHILQSEMPHLEVDATSGAKCIPSNPDLLLNLFLLSMVIVIYIFTS